MNIQMVLDFMLYGKPFRYHHHIIHILLYIETLLCVIYMYTFGYSTVEAPMEFRFI